MAATHLPSLLSPVRAPHLSATPAFVRAPPVPATVSLFPLPSPAFACAAAARPTGNVAEPRPARTSAVAEGSALSPAAEGEEVEAGASAAAAEEDPAQGEEFAGNDELLLYFKAEGTLSEAGIPRVTKALEACDGVENIRIKVLEGCATAECTRKTTVQAAAASSSLVEALQGAGFGLQTVCLGFNDDGTESSAELLDYFSAEGGDVWVESSGPPES